MAKSSPKYLKHNDRRWQTGWSRSKINILVFEWFPCSLQLVPCKDLVKHEEIPIADQNQELSKTDPLQLHKLRSDSECRVSTPEQSALPQGVQTKSITVSSYPFRKKEEKWKHHWLHALFSDSIHLSKLIFDIRSDLEGRHSDNSQKVENNIIPTNMNYLPAG